MQQRQEPDAAATAGKSEEEEEAELLDRLENAQRQLAQVRRDSDKCSFLSFCPDHDFLLPWPRCRPRDSANSC